MTCGEHASTHDGLDVQPCAIGQYPNRHHAALCSGCRSGLGVIGLHVRIERRADPERADRGSFSLGPLMRRSVA